MSNDRDIEQALAEQRTECAALHRASLDLVLQGLETLKAIVRGGANKDLVLEALVRVGAQFEELQAKVDR